MTTTPCPACEREECTCERWRITPKGRITGILTRRLGLDIDRASEIADEIVAAARPRPTSHVVLRPEDAVRFWVRVDTDGPEHPTLGKCWQWTGGLTDGYGVVSIDDRMRKVHRVLFETVKGPVAIGQTVDHLCRNRACVRPGHLEAVSHRINNLRGEGPAAVNSTKTHCNKGHELSGDNLVVELRTNGRPKRICAICRREWGRTTDSRRRPNRAKEAS